EPLDDLPNLSRLAQPRNHLDDERRLGEALPEGAEVLLGQDRGRHQHHHLLAVGGCLVGGAKRDLRLAVADVPADQAVHRPLRLSASLPPLTASIASIWSTVSRYGNAASNSSCISPSGGNACPRRTCRSA